MIRFAIRARSSEPIAPVMSAKQPITLKSGGIIITVSKVNEEAKRYYKEWAASFQVVAISRRVGSN